MHTEPDRQTEIGGQKVIRRDRRTDRRKTNLYYDELLLICGVPARGSIKTPRHSGHSDSSYNHNHVTRVSDGRASCAE